MLQGVSEAFEGFSGEFQRLLRDITVQQQGCYRGFQGHSRCLQGVQGISRALQGVSGVFQRILAVSRVFKCVPGDLSSEADASEVFYGVSRVFQGISSFKDVWGCSRAFQKALGIFHVVSKHSGDVSGVAGYFRGSQGVS